MLDGDEAGREAAEGIEDRLQGVVYQVQVVDLPHGVQPDNISDEELHRMLDWVPAMQ
jgi:DNA primase